MPGAADVNLGSLDAYNTTRQLNTHNLGSCEVHYPWHPWYGRTLWVYGTRAGRAQAAARCGLEPTQGSKSLEVPVWMLETTSCATMRLAESPQVDCVALQSLKTLLYDSVLQDRHPFSGGADANPNESTPTCAIGIVSSSIRGDPLAQAASRNPTQSGDVVGKAASRILGKPRVSCGDEGGQP
jgi:hypothetical protein